jgi:urease accessory protein
VGFVLVTGLLHACGIGIAVIERWSIGTVALRGMGAAISAVGVYLLTGHIR